ncbi:MAG: hypothetical protein EBR82_14465 [Caulobacteraceae bacterium]|nr:hypothetical protein [Caulobacteraceae bacterium]
MRGIPFQKGELWKGNKSGRPKGSRDFYLDFRDAIRKIKDLETGKNITELDIIRIGVEKMLKGDVRFEALYLDLLDRVYGKAIQPATLDVAGQIDFVVLPFKDNQALLKKDNLKQIEENNNDPA